MLHIDRSKVDAVQAAATGAELHGLVGEAVRLEHATIPPYLTAAYSLRSPANAAIRDAIVHIAVEEMLHVAILANVLNAIGGRPAFDTPAFVPTYPGPLPMSIGGGLVVGLHKFSKELNRDVFMAIEEPENPKHFPGLAVAAAPEFATIGAFYDALIAKITELGDGIFTGDPARQVIVDAGFPSEQLFPIIGVETAVRALRQVVREGEGTETLPLDDEGDLAHYYRFEEIDRGRRLVEDPSVAEGFSFTGEPVPFDPSGVLDLPANPKADDYAAGTPERAKVDAFNQAYSNMLRSLQRAFDGHPVEIGTAISAMFLVRRLAPSLVGTVDPGTGRPLGLTFEFLPG